MKNPPAFQFYARDWLADLDVRLLDPAEIGHYVMLLAYCWEGDGLPPEEEKLARLLALPLDAFRALWRSVGDKFRPVTTTDGREVLYNPRLWQQREEFRLKREQSARAAQQSLLSPNHPCNRVSKAVTGAPSPDAEPTVPATDPAKSATRGKATASAHAKATATTKRKAKGKAARLPNAVADAQAPAEADALAEAEAKAKPRARMRAAEEEAVEVAVEEEETEEGCRGETNPATPTAQPSASPQRGTDAPPPADDPPSPLPGTPERLLAQLPPGVTRGYPAGPPPAAPCAPLGASTAPIASPPPIQHPESRIQNSPPRRPHDARELTPGAWARILDRVTARLGPDWRPWRRILRPLWSSSSALAIAVPTTAHRDALLDHYGQDLAWAVTEAAGGIDLDLAIETIGTEQYDPADLAALDAAITAATPRTLALQEAIAP